MNGERKREWKKAKKEERGLRRMRKGDEKGEGKEIWKGRGERGKERR